MTKDSMQQFTEQWGFVVAVVASVSISSLFLSEGTLFLFLLLIFIGMLLVNSEKITKLLGGQIR